MLAIHTKSGSFVPEWIRYCQENNVAFKEVDCFASDIIKQLTGCYALLWHWAHHDYRAQLFARQLIVSIEEMGILVFPSSATCWHYDDKVGQKYLLESVGAPLVPSYVFYDKETALRWIGEASFPKVWKLRGGAGSQNVKLVRSKNEARKIIKRSFSKGCSNSRFHVLKDRIWHFRRDRSVKSFLNIFRGVVRAVIPHKNNANAQTQKNYVYFQDFVPDNNCDIRVIIIGKRAFAIKRMVRDGDFRASGSGTIHYERHEIPEECLCVAFDETERLRSQSCAFDFVQLNSKWLIVEISYAFNLSGYTSCPGYWDKTLQWHEAPVTPERFMIDDIFSAVRKKST